MSTPQAYRALDTVYSDFDGTKSTGGDMYFVKLIDGLSKNCLDINGLFNCFESAVLPECPGATEIKSRLLSLGATAAMMSGSGPSVFGLFDSLAVAKNATAELRKSGFKAYWCELV